MKSSPKSPTVSRLKDSRPNACRRSASNVTKMSSRYGSGAEALFHMTHPPAATTAAVSPATKSARLRGSAARTWRTNSGLSLKETSRPIAFLTS
jgi:hypothetical protein